MKRRLNLIAARKKAKLTQEQLARKIGTTKTMICNLETCFCGTNVEKWDKLAEILGMSSKKLRAVTEITETNEAAISDGQHNKK
jgi:transcriptional regulator with XRE-family HTH domain